MKRNKADVASLNKKKFFGIETPLFFLLLSALLIRIIFAITYIAMGGDGVAPDTSSYVEPALSFVESFSFGTSALRTPGYPIFLSFCMVILKNNFYYAVVIFQILLNVLAIYYLYKLSMIVVKNKKAAYLAAAIATLNLLDIRYCCIILTDSISQSFLIISIYYFACYILSLKDNRSAFGKLMVSSVLLAVNVLIRPSLMYLPYALAIGAAFVALICRRYRQIVISVICLSLLSGSCSVMWTMRNEKVANYSGYSTVSDINLYRYNATVVYAKQNSLSYYEAFDILKNHKDEGLQPYLESMPKYEAYRKRGMELIMSDLPYYLLCCVKDCAYIFFYPGMLSFDFVKDPLESTLTAVKSGTGVSFGTISLSSIFALVVLALDIILLLLLFLFLIIGSIKSIKKDWMISMVIVGVMAYVMAVSCQPVGVGAFSRFRMAISMFEILFAAHGVCVLYDQLKNRIVKKKEM